ncbi:MAG: hypothetical protein OXR66_03320 [Candidatus Woesearchaeota archaeon]|nr:hypothetical protein [Candidatus Woesearchaeota archaeon]
MDEKRIVQEVAGGLMKEEQLRKLFEFVRDIPYGDPGSRDPEEVYKQQRGTCSGKHALLKKLYAAIGVETQDWIAMHRFNDLPVEFSFEIYKLLETTEILDPHNFLKVNWCGTWITVDVTWEKSLKKFGFPCSEWGEETLCVVPSEIFVADDPVLEKEKRISELPKEVQWERTRFLQMLTAWLDSVRS